MGLAWRWTSRRTATGQRGFEATQPSRPDTAPSSSLRMEVCPPSLLDDGEAALSRLRSLLPRISRVRTWLQTGWSRLDDSAADGFANAPTGSSKRLHSAQTAFVAALEDMSSPAARNLLARACVAHALRDLWHLRNELFTLVAQCHCESVAHQRLAELDACFPSRSRRTLRVGQPGAGAQAPGRELRP